jgi:hypothetical protein
VGSIGNSTVKNKSQIVENKLKRLVQKNFYQFYSTQIPPQTMDFGNSKYPSSHLREENNYSLEAQQ